MSDNRSFLVALSTFPKFGSKRLLKFKEFFSNLKDGWEANLSSLLKMGLDENVAKEFIEFRKTVDPEKEWQKVEKEKLQVVTTEDPEYPELLKQIYDPPALLYCRGNLEILKQTPTLAVVGSRKPSLYGRQVINELIGPLANQGVTIVSGLALGIDALAHQATLDNQGKTIAVLGSGAEAESVYPAQNRHLAEKIIDNGGIIISEFPMGTLPLRHHFPIRNRIISGICPATLVVEATEDSGSLITAKCALEQNREVFSVPGSIFSALSLGPNNLLKLGAQVVTSAEDILHYLNIEPAQKLFKQEPLIGDSPTETALLKCLSRDPKHIDQIIKELALTSAEASSTLTLMEIKGRAKNLGGMMYILSR